MRSTVSRWRLPELRSGKGGVIPRRSIPDQPGGQRDGAAGRLPDPVRGARRLPGPAVPAGGQALAEARRGPPLWISLKVPMEAAPGNYTGSIRVAGRLRQNRNRRREAGGIPVCDSEEAQFENRVSIWETSLRRRFFPDEETMDVAKFTALVDRYAMMLVEHRLTPIIFGVPALLPKRWSIRRGRASKCSRTAPAK